MRKSHIDLLGARRAEDTRRQTSQGRDAASYADDIDLQKTDAGWVVVGRSRPFDWLAATARVLEGGSRLVDRRRLAEKHGGGIGHADIGR